MGQYFYVHNLSNPSKKKIFVGKAGEWIWDEVIKENNWSESDIIVARGDEGSTEYWYGDSEKKFEALKITNILKSFVAKLNLSVSINQIETFSLDFVRSSYNTESKENVEEKNISDKVNTLNDKVEQIYSNIDKIKSVIYEKN